MPFFKLHDAELAESSNIDGPGFSLTETGKDAHIYPVEGWHWFDSEDEARAHFGLAPLALKVESENDA